MTGWTAARVGRLRLLRRWRARKNGNPLLRRPAPAERLVASALAAIVVMTAAATCVGALGIYAAASRQARRDRAASHPVAATVVGQQNAGAAATAPLTGPPFGYTVGLRWSWHGQVRTGRETLYEDPAPGTLTTAWVDAAGRLTGPPWRGLDLVMIPAGVAMGGVLLTLTMAWAAARAFLAWTLRRRARLWDGEWSRVGPLWTRHQGLR
jgi:hypothetical protein